MYDILMYDIAIIGGGPSGIYAYKELKKQFNSKNIILIEKSNIAGNIRKYPSQLWHSTMNELIYENDKNMNFYPTNEQVIKYYENYFNNNNYSFIKNNVIDIKNNDIYCEKGEIIKAKIIIICVGIFESKRILNINTNNVEYINYGYPNINIKNKKLVLIGGGNSSIDYINQWLPNNEIIWVIKGNSYTKHIPQIQNELLNNNLNKYNKNIKIYKNTTVIEFGLNNNIILSNGLHIENIYQCNILIGFTGRNKLLERIKINFDEEDNPILNDNLKTNLDNIYLYGACSNPKKFSIDCWIIPLYLNKIIDDLKHKL